MEFLQTQRLALRNLAPGDVTVMAGYRNREACSRYQRWEDFTESAIEALIANHQEDRFLSETPEQHYAVALRGTGELVGELACFFTPGDCVTLGITISDRHHRKGFAKELLTEVTARIRTKYPALDIVALIEKENEASIRLFEALGFRLECWADSIASYVYVLPGLAET